MKQPPDNSSSRRKKHLMDLAFGRTIPALLLSVFIVLKLEISYSIGTEVANSVGNPDLWLHLLNQLFGLFYFSLLVVLFVVRLPKRSGNFSLFVWGVAMFATFGLIFVPFLPNQVSHPKLYLLSDILGPLGLVYSLWALLYLRRSFSFMPETRRLVTGGPYALSRHPLYVGEAIASCGILLPILGWPAIIVLGLYFFSQWLRINWEEKILSSEFPEYLEFAKSVPKYFPNPFRIARFKDFLSAKTLMLGGVLIASGSAFFSSVGDPDFWWHLRVGQWIIENRSLPEHDLFTYTVNSHYWAGHEWLTEVLIYGVYKTGGLLLFSLIVGIITFIGFLFICKRAHILSQPPVIAGLALAVGIAAGGPIWGPRAQMLTFLLFCIELYLIDHIRKFPRSKLAWLIPLLVLFWANLHGSFVLAFAPLGLLLLVNLSALRTKNYQPLISIASLIGISLLAGMITPHGVGAYLYALIPQTSQAQQQYIAEWLSPNFHQWPIRPYELMVLLLVTGFAIRRPKLYDFLLFLFVLVISLQSVRHIALFVAATTPILITHWSGIYSKHKSKLPWHFSNSAPTGFMALTTLIILCSITFVIGAKVSKDLSGQNALIADQYPVAASNWLDAHPEVGHRMFNQYGWGGYLAWRFYPDPNRKVFIYGEATVMGDPFMRDYLQVAGIGPHWQEVLDKYQVDMVVFNTNEPLCNLLETNSRWKKVYSDSKTTIFVRQDMNYLVA